MRARGPEHMTSRIIIAGHSVLHPRQEALSIELARLGNEVVSIGPRQWNEEAYEPKEMVVDGHGRYESRPLQVRGGGIFGFSFEGWEDVAKEVCPDLVYLQQEPFSKFAYEVAAWAKDERVPLLVFSWENRPGVGAEARGMERQVLEACSGVVAGNSLAKQRMEGVLGRPLQRCQVAPQTGVDMGRYCPLPDTKTDFHVIYHGRFVREKGIHFIETACKELGLDLLITGGRGNYIPKEYKHIEGGWMPDSELPTWINKAMVSATCSWGFKNYLEQWPAAPAIAAAAGLQVLITDNGSMPEHYGTAPFYVAKQANQESITAGIKDLLDHPRPGGREWVEKHMSARAIAERVDRFFREVLDA